MHRFLALFFAVCLALITVPTKAQGFGFSLGNRDGGFGFGFGDRGRDFDRRRSFRNSRRHFGRFGRWWDTCCRDCHFHRKPREGAGPPYID